MGKLANLQNAVLSARSEDSLLKARKELSVELRNRRAVEVAVLVCHSKMHKSQEVAKQSRWDVAVEAAKQSFREAVAEALDSEDFGSEKVMEANKALQKAKAERANAVMDEINDDLF